jgi:hypothetical protein
MQCPHSQLHSQTSRKSSAPQPTMLTSDQFSCQALEFIFVRSQKGGRQADCQLCGQLSLHRNL